MRQVYWSVVRVTDVWASTSNETGDNQRDSRLHFDLSLIYTPRSDAARRIRCLCSQQHPAVTESDNATKLTSALGGRCVGFCGGTGCAKMSALRHKHRRRGAQHPQSVSEECRGNTALETVQSEVAVAFMMPSEIEGLLLWIVRRRLLSYSCDWPRGEMRVRRMRSDTKDVTHPHRMHAGFIDLAFVLPRPLAHRCCIAGRPTSLPICAR
ncbi:hypothetical protein BU25DRAFT_447699 [Macroventuria anomochaeta]|uniref:Uncharacterized protein n=1 Tax=Macroventuria anomochaeta TaxID=301207 RepID=A0ACB6S377_9PLEO|nr:uncharacterized protein BU25DRAFT_447699 [Macroventuria anomochaeta]KAF2628695.1 hypothetical protein BU25DRAFT_447699 [Macroventuria anomochaeta]